MSFNLPLTIFYSFVFFGIFPSPPSDPSKNPFKTSLILCGCLAGAFVLFIFASGR